MGKKVYVIAGSARKGGNTDILCDEFIRGAQDAGHETEKVYIVDKNISGCVGCFACQKNSGICSVKDDMEELNAKMMEADVIVFASPVYFYTWNSQTKMVVDRSFSIEKRAQNKTFYLISAASAPSEMYMDTLKLSFQQYIGCFRAGGNKIGGYVFGPGTSDRGDVRHTRAMKAAYEAGKMI